MKLAWQDTRTHVRKQPPAHLAVNIFTTPLALFGRLVGPWILQTLRILRERRLRQLESRGRWRQRRLARVHEQVMHSNIDTEFRWRCHGDHLQRGCTTHRSMISGSEKNVRKKNC